uniref:Uncharacterized protein n=1 Tax=viral metagenome TaxID=1070528 RepID=A0A6M3K5Q6_9ZZZZ
MSNQLTASEAIFGFCAWITTRKEKLSVGANEDCSPIVKLIDEFCGINDLEEPRENYTDYLDMPA